MSSYVPPQEPGHGNVFIYFIGIKGEADGPVKIGKTSNLEQRLAAHQISNHQDLELLAFVECPRPIEKWIHRLHRDDNIRGEWFKRTERLKALMEAASKGEDALYEFLDLSVFEKGVLKKLRPLSFRYPEKKTA